MKKIILPLLLLMTNLFIFAEKEPFILKGKQLWEKRHSPEKALEAMKIFHQAAYESQEKDYESLCLFAYSSNFYAKFFEKDKDQKEDFYLKASKASQKAISLNPNGMEAHLLLGISYAELAQLNKSLSYIEKAKEVFEWIEKKSPDYQNGFALMVLGRLYSKAPGWPISFGDDDLSLKYFEKAMAISKKLRFTYLYYAEALFDAGENQKALEILRTGIKLPVNEKELTEENYCLAKMKKLEKEILED
ncbi:MAG TPA: hypothetical protein DHW82_07160 [Spirochaetia bacterium]|nr:MAG: hypothetical protein A2Y41_11000 [Spirochaetes bacterium GWB1_36_13]HCL56772.1 hypothetical protein [Spirochaetia bacterium]